MEIMHKRGRSSSEDRAPLVGGVGRSSPQQHFGNGTNGNFGHGLTANPSRYVVMTKSSFLRRMLKSSSTPSECDATEIRVDLDSVCNRIIRLIVLLIGIAISIVYFGAGLGIDGANRPTTGSEAGARIEPSAFNLPSLPFGGLGGEPNPMPNPPPQSLLVARSKRWEAEEEENCRFPSFMNVDETFYSMHKGTYMQEYGDDLRKGHFRYRLKFSRGRHSTELDRDIKKANETGKKSISFLHIGKAGGSSLVCHLRGALKFGYHCPHYSSRASTVVGFPLDGDKESMISKMVNCYVHYDFRMHCYDNPTLAINVRNPIDRLASWYHYEHLENMDVLWKDRIKSCGQQMLYKCYNSFHDLAQYGLAGVRPPPTQLMHVKYNASEEICRHWAWATVQGTAPASFHNVWNYDWFGSPAIAFEKEIIAFRTKHVEEDWSQVDKMLGGDGAVPTAMHLNDASAKKIAVYNKTVSEEGHLNLCRALCHEIQVYKQILVKAINLNETDVLESLQELNCPDDMTPEVRFCPQSYIDYSVE